MKERKTHENLKEKAFEAFKEELAAEEGKMTDELVSYTYHSKEESRSKTNGRRKGRQEGKTRQAAKEAKRARKKEKQDGNGEEEEETLRRQSADWRCGRGYRIVVAVDLGIAC